METLRYVLPVNGLLAVVSLTYYVLLRRDTFFRTNRLVLWVGLAASLGLPLLNLPDWRPQPVRNVLEHTARVIAPNVLPRPAKPDVRITFPDGRVYRAFPARTPATDGGSWPIMLMGLYVVIAGALLVRFGVQVLLLRRLIRQSAQEPYDDFVLVRSAGVESPFSFFRWVVLDPDRYAPDELEQILRHERVHVRQWHSLDMIGVELVCIVLWFNPAAYLFRQLLRQTLEFTADRTVLNEGVDPKAYQYHLVKVSLSVEPSTLTNQFSTSALKSRIAMINHPRSTNATWLKYLVLVLATLTVATLFARPKARTLAKFMPKPTAQAVATVLNTELPRPAVPAPAGWADSLKTGQTSSQEPLNDVAIRADSVLNRVPAPDSARVSPSRYMQYEGDKLYWVVTPKTSFDDLAIMKREFERHGYKMQIQALKYDPLDAYITEIKVTVIRPVVGVSDLEETGINGGPIRSHGGFNGLNTLKTVAVVDSYPFDEDMLRLPRRLAQIVRDEEQSVATFIQDRKMEYLVLTGKKKYGHLGMGFRQFDKEAIRMQSSPNSSISVKPDGFLLINESPGEVIKVFINNEPVTLEDIKRLKISQLYTLAVILGYDNAAQKRTMTDYLLFYVNEDK